MPSDFYDVLGVDEDASRQELKDAYRARVREYHPDVNDDPQSDQQFKLVRKAHEVLSDATERKAYDRLGHAEYTSTRMDSVPHLSVFGGEAASATTSGSSGSSGAGSSSRTTSSSRSASSRSSSSRSASSRSTSSPSSSSSRSSTSSSTTSTTSASTTSSASTSTGSTSNRRRSGHATGNGTGSSTTSSWESATSTRQRQPDVTAAQRRRRMLRWYAAIVAGFAVYLVGLGFYLGANAGVLGPLLGSLLADPAATLASQSGLASPLGFSTAALATESLALALPVGAVLLPLALVSTVARYGRGVAWAYAGASLGPAVAIGVSAVAPAAGVVLLGLVLLPIAGSIGFLVDVGRYLFGWG